MDNIIEMYAIAVLDEDNTEWNIDRVPPQIKSAVEDKIEELERNEKLDKMERGEDE